MKYLFAFGLICWSLALSAQKNGTVEGTVSDSSSTGLAAVTVLLLQEKDSVMASFAQSDASGHFLLRRVAAGKYLLQINYLGYQTHYQQVVISAENPKVSLGNITLRPGATLLQSVDVRAERAPLYMRNDTLEYNAAAFKTQPGSVVEDLLKKLPGVQVDKNGTIRAQGEQVRNVLVDGKEFFGNDPKIATKNLPADAVDRVQVYDKKSEKAEFTGIDDGQEQKTINLKLKDDKKQGYFGTATAGAGSQERFEGKFNLNKFGKKVQASALGMANNTNQQGFSFEDYINFMGGLGNFMSGGGGGGRMRISFDPSQMGMPMGFGLENGFTNTWSGGLNLNSDLSKNTEIGGNYFYSNLSNRQNRITTQQNIVNSQTFGSEENENRETGNAGHRLNLTFKHKIDSSQNLTLRGSLSYNDARFESLGNAQSTNQNNELQNSSQRDNVSTGTQLQANARLVYRKRFNRRGRALVAESAFESGNTDRNGRVDALNTYYNAGMQLFSDPLNQRQAYTDDAGNYSLSLSYTEPLGHRQYLEWQGAHRQYFNTTYKDFYDVYTTPMPGEVYNPALSNRFRRGYRYERAGLNYMLNRADYNLTVGAALQRSELDGRWLESSLLPINQSFTQVLPSAFFNYEFKQGRNFSLDYNTELREPSLEQLQPVVNNSDPLNLFVGNPRLRPEFQHNLTLHFMNFDQFTMTSLFANAQVQYTTNQITNASSVDSLLRRTLTPVNVASALTTNSFIGFNTPLRFIKTNFGIQLNLGYNRGILFVNEVKNNTDRWNNRLEITFDNRNKNRVDWNIGASVGLNSMRYSVSEALNQFYYTQNYFGDVSWFINKKWTLGSGVDMTVYSGENFGAQRNVLLWRANIGRFFLKNNRGQLKFQANDLLNQNIGIQRSAQLNYVQEQRIATLARYFMLTFQYSLSGFNREKGAIEFRMRGGG